MKKTFSFILFVSFILNINGQVLKTIDVAIPGTLTTLLTATEKSTITNLTVTGNIDARDIKCIRDEIGGRTKIDLSNANIQAYSGLGGTINAYEQGFDSYSDYPANTLPVNAFYRYKTITSIVYSINQNIDTVILPKSLMTIGSNAFIVLMA